MRANWLVVVLLVVFHQALGAVWYAAFGPPWVAGLGKTVAELTARGDVPYVISMAGSAFTVIFVAALFERLAVRGALRGFGWGAVLWLCLVAPFCAIHYAFSAVALVVAEVDLGMALAGLLVTGAVLGAWRARPAAVRSVPTAIAA